MIDSRPAAPRPPAIVLVGTQEEGNIGATARAMANMGLHELILVAPRQPIGVQARALAVRAGRILDEAVVAPDLARALAPFQRVVGTTSARGRGLERVPIAARELPAALAADPPGTRTALVFGPEASGLTTEQLARCAPWVHVPCSRELPTLNLAQAVLVVAYELFVARPREPRVRAVADPLAAQASIDGLFAHLPPVLRRVGFARDGSFETVMRDLRRLASRARLTEREVAIFRGICRRSEALLDRLPSREEGASAWRANSMLRLRHDRLTPPMLAEKTTRDVAAALARSPIVGVVRTDSTAAARRQAMQLMECGIEIVEITFTVPDASSLVRELLGARTAGGPPWIGMGSVTTRERALEAVDAGAELIVSPNAAAAVATVAKAAGLFLVLGALTPTEIVRARELGADLVKVYPLPAVGGPSYLAVVRGPLADVPMLAAGGFTVDEIPAYRTAGACAFGMAAPLVLGTGRSIHESARHALKLARGEP
ncbi:MAG: TrmJ/YjtD family RNA methyltransferase [Acidobacteriota bacterium]|nr:TrmJ/YjtD family RNA methyltransferase [Acidobacteriota bacterium]MDH3522566.1 TrmJ/YjtD family RNA methyltransferase [Acidobacteriota bacterium]